MVDIRDNDPAFLLGLTRDIVTAYISHNEVPPEALASLIDHVYKALDLAPQSELVEDETVELVPAIAVEASVTPDHIICLEDGLAFKSLRRHIRSKYGLTPEDYREKWNLPPSYPMVAPNYAKERSRIAKMSGLGRKALDP